MCYYCHESAHTKRNCKTSENKQQRAQSANVAHTTIPYKNTILVSIDEFTQFSQYQESL